MRHGRLKLIDADRHNDVSAVRYHLILTAGETNDTVQYQRKGRLKGNLKGNILLVTHDDYTQESTACDGDSS
jgi:hypothetical protein